ncbi:MAG: HNH endonuclease, partial [Candidatus Eiseniibacteriota bacterium]
MKRSAPQLSDSALLHRLHLLVAHDCATTAELLDHIAEVDERRLYLPAAYPSMFAYCVGEFHLSEDAAFKRIQAARAARRFPAIFEAVAQGRLHLSAVCLLAPHLTEDTAEDLLAAATHQSKSEIEQLLAERFPRPDLPTRVQAIPMAPLQVAADQLAPGQVRGALAPKDVGEDQEPAPDRRGEALQLAPGQVPPGRADDRPTMRPLAPQRFAVQFTMGQSAHDKLRHAQELLSHELPAADIAQVFERALDALIPQLEQRKFAAAAKPSRSRRPTRSPRHIPAHVMRAVKERDQGQCTLVSESGQRCPARTRLEFDHIQEVARGGGATVD